MTSLGLFRSRAVEARMEISPFLSPPVPSPFFRGSWTFSLLSLFTTKLLFSFLSETFSRTPPLFFPSFSPPRVHLDYKVFLSFFFFTPCQLRKERAWFLTLPPFFSGEIVIWMSFPQIKNGSFVSPSPGTRIGVLSLPSCYSRILFFFYGPLRKSFSFFRV